MNLIRLASMLAAVSSDSAKSELCNQCLKDLSGYIECLGVNVSEVECDPETICMTTKNGPECDYISNTVNCKTNGYQVCGYDNTSYFTCVNNTWKYDRCKYNMSSCYKLEDTLHCL